jgi:hypothetical protein
MWHVIFKVQWPTFGKVFTFEMFILLFLIVCMCACAYVYVCLCVCVCVCVFVHIPTMYTQMLKEEQIGCWVILSWIYRWLWLTGTVGAGNRIRAQCKKSEIRHWPFQPASILKSKKKWHLAVSNNILDSSCFYPSNVSALVMKSMDLKTLNRLVQDL